MGRLLNRMIHGITMQHREMALLRVECIRGNERACDTLEQVCESGRDEVCQYVPD